MPKNHAVVPVCMQALEEFLSRCDRMIVLLSWHYFSRLWCMYEWAAFLVHHHPRELHVRVDGMMRKASAEAFRQSVHDSAAE